MTARLTAQALARDIRAAQMAGLTVTAIDRGRVIVTPLPESHEPAHPDPSANGVAKCDQIFGVTS